MVFTGVLSADGVAEKGRNGTGTKALQDAAGIQGQLCINIFLFSQAHLNS